MIVKSSMKKVSRNRDEDESGILGTLAGIKQTKKKEGFKDLTKQRNDAQNRKNLIKEISTKYGFDSKAVRKMHEVYLEQEMSAKLNFNKFLKFLKVDDAPLLKNTFETLAGNANGNLDARVLMLLLMNVSPLSKEEKLKFAFNLFDEEDSRMITYKELLKIL